jgi:hypothetical protein
VGDDDTSLSVQWLPWPELCDRGAHYGDPLGGRNTIGYMQIQTTLMSFRVSREVRASLEAIRERDGIPISEQLRRALAQWIEQQGIRNVTRPKARPRQR